MNIIIHRYNSICEPDFIDAFRSLGINVIEDKAEMTDKNISIENRVATLGEMILVNKPLFVFSINFFPYISMICEKLNVLYVCVSVDCPVVELYSTMVKNKCNRIFLFDYEQFLDVHEANPDCIFHMPLGVNVKRINDTIGEPDWGQIEADGKSGKGFYKYDISLIGSLYNEKNNFSDIYAKLPERYKGMCDGFIASQRLLNGQKLIEQSIPDELINAIKVAAGKEFYPSDLSVKNMDKYVAVNDYLSVELTVRDRHELLSIMSEVMAEYGKVHLFTRSDSAKLMNASNKNNLCIHGGVSSLYEMPRVFRETKINLNPTIRSIQMGLPQRIWDVLGAGGFMLTNYQAEIPEYFEVGKHLEAYESLEEACEKAAYYLTHEEERIEIARNGYELVKNKHTVLARVIDIIKIISG